MRPSSIVFLFICAFFSSRSVLAQGQSDALHIDSIGNVGIGTDKPSAKLDVNGTAKINGDVVLSMSGMLKTSASGNYINLQDGWRNMYIKVSRGFVVGDERSERLKVEDGAIWLKDQNKTSILKGDENYATFNDNGDVSLFVINRRERTILIGGDTKFGIGTLSPNFPLSVEASVIYSSFFTTDNLHSKKRREYGYDNPAKYDWIRATFNPVNNQPNTAMIKLPIIANRAFSVYSEGPILTNDVYAFSDKRYKTDLHRADIKTDLEKVNQLQVTDYRYIDSAMLGKVPSHGFIAQEVEQVFPNAVITFTGYMPDIYAVAVDYNVFGDSLVVTMGKHHHLCNGNKVRLFADGTEKVEMPVQVIDSNTFCVKQWNKPIKEGVFVYGKQVNDFHAVDYSQVFVAGIGAIQQLTKEVNALKEENKQLKAQQQGYANRLEAVEAFIEMHGKTAGK